MTLESSIVEVFVASAASSSGVGARAKPKAGLRGGEQGSSETLRANAGDGEGASELPRSRDRSLPVMREPCEHALAADPRLVRGANATHRYITCYRCLPDHFGTHVAKAWRNDGEQLWRYFMASLLFTPKGRTIFPVSDPTQVRLVARGRAPGAPQNVTRARESASLKQAIEGRVPTV